MIDYIPRQNTDRIVVHCSATKASQDIGEDEIREWHQERGWIDLGYNIVIRRNGQIEVGRPLEYRGAHVYGYNATSLGVCLIGGLNISDQPEANYTPEQWDTLELTLRWLKRIWPNAEIMGHNDLTPLKACPCFKVKDWLDKINGDLS